MTETDLKEAIFEARRFIKAAEKARTRIKNHKWSWSIASAETAAAKRASMDLTRVLVRVRS